MQPKYPNTPTAAERKRQRTRKAAELAQMFLLTAAAIVFFTLTIIFFN